ncbi:MAG: hypothetical protein ACI9VM_000222 [Candidatus Azotimanducaceae bacterium]|jgi:hypothetical protein
MKANILDYIILISPVAAWFIHSAIGSSVSNTVSVYFLVFTGLSTLLALIITPRVIKFVLNNNGATRKFALFSLLAFGAFLAYLFTIMFLL